MAVQTSETRSVRSVEHPALQRFNQEFGTESDLSRYDTITSDQRATSAEAVYLNQLQTNSYIPTRSALLLKNNLHDIPFLTHTTRSVLYTLKQERKIGDACFYFLHEKLNAQDFKSVYRLLYILMLYSKIAEHHDANVSEPAFAFESFANYSDKLIQSPPHVLAKEEFSLQRQARKTFLQNWLTSLATSPGCTEEAKRQILTASAALDHTDPKQFRTQFLALLDKLQKKAPELEQICWRELQANLARFTEGEFFDQVYLRLKTESYYKDCLSRVSTLRQSLERTESQDLLTLTEKCKKAYNGCVYLLGDSKNLPACSPMRFAALTGKMRTEWLAINNIFSRAQGAYAHHLCACQVQSPPSQSNLASWPFNSHPLIDFKPASPLTPAQLTARGIDVATFVANQKKTVAIIGCKRGGGHMEASRGIATNLSSLGYHPITVDLPEVLISEDPVRNNFLTRWLGKNWSIATLFEGLMKHKAFAIVNFLLWAQAKLFSTKGCSQTQVHLVMEQLLKLNPDSVITTYSSDNEALIEACKILGIPCLHVATDVDTSVVTRDTPPDYNHFKMALPFQAPESRDPVQTTTASGQRFVSGPPIRHAFTARRTLEDIQRFKQKWGIELHKKVVVISSGKNGSFSPYAEMLAKKYANTPPANIPIHLVVICGKTNTDFKRHLERNVAPKTQLPMAIELSYDEEKMEELLSMASHGGVLVGKAGGMTVFETFARGNRLLVDDVRPRLLSGGFFHFCITLLEISLRKLGFAKQLTWEKINMDFAKKHGLADTFEEEKEFLPKLERQLNNNNLPVAHGVEVKNVEREIPVSLSQMMAKTHFDPETVRARQVHRNL